MKNAYPANAPSPTSEKHDDERKLDFKPNGDDVHYFNLGYGNRWVSNKRYVFEEYPATPVQS